MNTKNLIPLERDKNVKIIVDIYNFAIKKIRENPQLLEVKTDQTRKVAKGNRKIPEMWKMHFQLQ